MIDYFKSPRSGLHKGYTFLNYFYDNYILYTMLTFGGSAILLGEYLKVEDIVYLYFSIALFMFSLVGIIGTIYTWGKKKKQWEK